MATLMSDDVLSELQLSASSNEKSLDYEDYNSNSSDLDSDHSTGDEQPPSFPPSPTLSVTKKQKFASDKRESYTKDCYSSTPRRIKGKVRPKQLGSDKRSSKSVRKTKCHIFDFTSDSVDMSTEDPVDGKKQASVLSVLKNISTTLNELVDRVENTEKEIKSVKSKLADTSSPSSSSESVSSRKLQTSVPNIIRSETRKVYKTLQDEVDGFSGFAVGPSVTFEDLSNQRVVSKLIKEVQTTNPSFQACQIRAAAKTYFRSLKQDASLERRGKSENRKKTRRQRERILRKLQERQVAFKKGAYQDKEKWSKVLVYDFMSSEESAFEDENDCIVVKNLPWRSSLVSKFMESLDEKAMKDKSSQSLRQMKRRVTATTPSRRPKPGGHLPKWMFTEEVSFSS